MNLTELLHIVSSFSRDNPVIVLVFILLIIFMLYRKPKLLFSVVILVLFLLLILYVIMNIASTGTSQKEKLIEKGTHKLDDSR